MPTVLITGGASGIGLSCGRHLKTHGWGVVVADSDRSGAERAARELDGRHLVVDVTDAAGMAAALRTDLADAEPLAGVVTSAGLTRTGEVSELSVEDWRTVLDVDLTGTFVTCQTVLPHLTPGASIVTIASVAALRPMRGRAAYCAAKAGVVALTEVLAAEWAERGIRVNAVAPGWVDTPFLQDAARRGIVDLEELSSRAPLGGLTTVTDVAEAVGFLLSTEARFVTGHTMVVDGGWTRLH